MHCKGTHCGSTAMAGALYGRRRLDTPAMDACARGEAALWSSAMELCG